MTEQNNETPEQVIEEPQESFQSIGQYIKQQRESSGHSLKYISGKTKISLSQLESLENDRLDMLPDKTYVQGFIKAFGKYIDLDGEKAIAKLNQTYEQLYPEKKHIDLKILTPKETSNTSPLMLVGVIGLAIVFLGYGVINYLKNRSLEKIRAELQAPIKTRTLTSETPLMKETVKKPEVVIVTKEEEQKEVELEAKEEPTPAPAPEVVEVKKEEKKEEVKKVEEAEKKDEVKFYPITFTMYEKETENAQALVKEHLPDNIKAAVTANEQNVYIKAVDGDTWITYKKDLLPVKKFILRKGRTLFISGKIIRIFLGNVHVTKIFLNNDPLKIESKSGVKSLVFPQERSKDYKLPLFVFKDTGEVIPSDQYIQDL
ncbi:MAG: helix-turn-helix domain-containing protein [Bacteriovoracaceae bacterium]